MRVDRKPSGLAASFPKGLAIGTLAAMASTLALSALLAGLIVSGTVREGSLGYGVMALVFLSAALGGSVAYGRIKHRRALVFLGFSCPPERERGGRARKNIGRFVKLHKNP